MSGLTIESRQAELEALHAQIFGVQPVLALEKPASSVTPSLSDEDLLDEARIANNGEKFEALYIHGDTSAYDGDDSRADLALCSMLTFWSGGDPAQIDRLFRASGLMRAKWDSKRGETTYGRMTIKKALLGATEFYGATGLGTTHEEYQEALEALSSLGTSAELSEIQQVLRSLGEGVVGASLLETQAVREQAIRALRGKVGAPARFIDAALAAGRVAAQREVADEASIWGAPAVDAPEGGESKETQAQTVIRLAAEAELFRTPDGEAYGTIPVGFHRETCQLNSKSFRRWLLRCFYERTGKPPGSQALQDAIDLLTARALFESEEHPVFVRIAEKDGALYLDLGNSDWEVVEITRNGFGVVADPPVKFRRPAAMLSLPTPIGGGSVHDFRRFVNVSSDGDFLLILAWLVASLRPRGPFPILILQGEQGTAKSTLGRLLRSLIDPTKAPLRSAPREERDLVISASSSWCLAFDNLSNIVPWLADALCRIATGGGFATRRLYSDAEEMIFDAQRPIVLNGITDLATRPDMADRGLIIQLEPIPEDRRRTEAELWSEFEAVRPRILGALLDVVSVALRQVDSVRLQVLPRMADFAVWATAAETALGFEEGAFLSAYMGNRSNAVELALEADPVAVAVRALLTRHGQWSGTSTELFLALTDFVPERTQRSQAWPKAAGALSKRLKRAATALRAVGVEVEFARQSNRGRGRLIRLSLRSQESMVEAESDSRTAVRTAHRTGGEGRKLLEKKDLDSVDGSDGSLQSQSVEEREVIQL